MTKKEAILQTATFLFAQKGYKETSISELSKLTQVAEGTIFYHFKNKETLFLAILEKTREVILSEYEQFVKDKSVQNGMELMENSIYFYLYLAGKFESQLLLLHRHFPYQLALENKDCRNHLEAIYDCLVNIFERAVLEGIKDGSMDELPARKMALIIFSMMDGIVRLKIYNLYNVSSLMDDIILSCRRILKASINP
ncbi:MAG: TetR/AcrR family transcriptional regulator [Proteobacteria bacterium]|nr:TetR/AcrR family transcriptional regulator [Pseudomonadota bacterium]MBU4469457.1 TetR/AcrR family transcriptional regulator [Pseudomonadota bacterium]MCG2752358.1 TetR/AcrR family transcriptional regulator [Desulfobacteraceae bacterium]